MAHQLRAGPALLTEFTTTHRPADAPRSQDAAPQPTGGSMKFTLFEQAPYRYLPDDFELHHDSMCTTPYSLTTRDGVYSSIRDFMDELMLGARSGFDGISVT